MKKVIFWDFDGTLSYSNKSFFSVLQKALCECGYDINVKETETFMQSAYPWHTPEQDHSAHINEKWWEAMFDKIDAFCIQKGVKQSDLPKINHSFKTLLIDVENYCLYSDAISVLSKCIELGYINYVVTNNYPEIIENVEKLGIAAFFTNYVVSSLVGYDKPRKEIYDYALKLAGNPEICYMIGDNPVADIAGAKNAGLKTVYVHNGFLNEADFSIDNLTDLLEILR